MPADSDPGSAPGPDRVTAPSLPHTWRPVRRAHRGRGARRDADRDRRLRLVRLRRRDPRPVHPARARHAGAARADAVRGVLRPDALPGERDDGRAHGGQRLPQADLRVVAGHPGLAAPRGARGEPSTSPTAPPCRSWASRAPTARGPAGRSGRSARPSPRTPPTDASATRKPGASRGGGALRSAACPTSAPEHATRDDAAAINDLMAAAEAVDRTDEHYSVEDVLEELDNPMIDLARDWVVVEVDGRIVAHTPAHAAGAVRRVAQGRDRRDRPSRPPRPGARVAAGAGHDRPGARVRARARRPAAGDRRHRPVRRTPTWPTSSRATGCARTGGTS